MPLREDVTRVLARLNEGREGAAAELMDLIYADLHKLAGLELHGERPAHTLQATALVNEAFIRLLGGAQCEWANRKHFFCAAATAMRRILIDYARKRDAMKRGGGRRKLSLQDDLEMLDLSYERLPQALAVHDALENLQALDERQAKVVELRFFAGLSWSETAEILGVSERTVRREWRFARAWLYREIGEL